jgi:catechol 2,3-dioxygenase-like lactoylglutathione lyase family enzyme
VTDKREERGRGARPGPKVRWLITLSLLAAIALGLLWVFFPRPPIADHGPRTVPSDPRLTYSGPFRNVHPGVQYVPEGRCADCHADLATSYAGHPMGRSLQPIARAVEGPLPGSSFEAFGSQFLVERDGDHMRHRRTRLDPAGLPAAEQVWEVAYVIGSGERGYSYLTDWDGYLFQTPVSWYAQKKVWDVSPGFGPALLTGRAVLPDCLFCHANRAHHVEGSVNHYTEPVFDGHTIGCQRCHGPGELHAAGPGAGKGPDGIDPTIVNPKHLAADLREAVCEQCHLQGAVRIPGRGCGLYDFRPGLPLASFLSVFVRAAEGGEGQKAIGHVEQMHQSRCFQGRDPLTPRPPLPPGERGSKTDSLLPSPPGGGGAGGAGQLGCISCHDPHARVPPARRVAYYRSRCLQCHEQKGCSLPLADRLRRTAEDSCIDCHMPRYEASDNPHTAATDHRILRGGKAPPRRDAQPTPGDGLPVVSFYRGRKEVDDEEDERARALALVKQALAGDVSAVRAVGRALPVLETAWRRDSDDLAVGEAAGYALAMQNRPTEARAAFEAVLAAAPDRELALVGAAAAAETLGQTEVALGWWRRAVAANPWALGYRRSLALLLVKKEAWQEAQPECQAWVRLDPIRAEARTARVQCLLAAGDKEEARAEFARVEALAPANLRELQIRFAKKLR